MEDLTGQRFGRLVVIGGHERIGGITYWDFRCDCGVIKRLAARNVKNGRVSSCGCYRKDATAERMTKHGQSTRKDGMTKEYAIWGSMIQRCYNENVGHYDNYGGRGITVCERWHKFENFLADMGKKPVGASIDRIDNNGNYEPPNCRWATPREQANNRRNTIFVEYNGAATPLAVVAEITGIEYNLLLQRHYRGWPLDLAISTPKGPVGERWRNPVSAQF